MFDEITPERTIPHNETIKCYYCKNEMLPDAKVCSSCLHYKRGVINWIKLVASGTALLMVLVAIAQLILATGEKIDTGRMLEEVEGIKTDAKLIFQDIENKEALISKRLAEISNNIDLLDRKYDDSRVQLENKTSELSANIEETKKSAEREIQKILASVTKQASASKERFQAIEADFTDKQEELSSQLEILKRELSVQLAELTWRNNLARLTDKAIVSGDRAAFNELKKLSKELFGTDKGQIVLSHVLQVKRFYLNIQRYKSVQVKRKGEVVNLEKEPTVFLLNQLKTNMNDSVRFKIAEFIKKRERKGCSRCFD